MPDLSQNSDNDRRSNQIKLFFSVSQLGRRVSFFAAYNNSSAQLFQDPNASFLYKVGLSNFLFFTPIDLFLHQVLNRSSPHRM